MRKKKKINLKRGVVREGGRDKRGTLWELYVITIKDRGDPGEEVVCGICLNLLDH